MIELSYITSTVLFCMGLLCITVKRELFKIIIGLSLMEGSLLLMLVTAGYSKDGVPPLFPLAGTSVNPLPHSFTLTAIVIGACEIALALALAVKLHRYYHTTDISEYRGLHG